MARFSGGSGGEGTPGPEGPPGADGESFSFRGAYGGPEIIYNLNDVVTYNGSSYICLSNNITGSQPDSLVSWDIFVEQGADGADGADANTGDITFDGVKIIGAGTASGDGANLGTIELVPDGNLTSDQYLIIDPTAPNHIHIRAGGTQDASNADLIIGGEDTNLLVSDTGDYLDIRTTSETATNIWRFGSDGILSGPGMSTLYTYWITAPESSLKLSSSSDQVILNGATGEFLNDETDPANQIATIGDVNSGRFGASASYHSRVDQGPHSPANTVQPFTFSTTDWETGIQRVDNTKIKMLSAGKYNIAFSAQLYQTSNTGTVNIWLNKNGSPMAYTNTKVVVESNAPYKVAAWNFFVDAATNDYYELIWSSSSVHTKIEYDAEQTINGNLHPEIPSIIVTVNQVG
jgi:hypothetical protein